MLLRRITEHIKAQNWTAVALDFVIVVVGVFIGIQVSNWNDARGETRQEREILASVAEDLTLDRAELEAGLSFLRTSISASNYALEAIGENRVETLFMPAQSAPGLGISSEVVNVPTAPEPKGEATDRLWSSTVVAYYPSASLAAYETLVNTGKLGIIKDADLVQDLQNYRQLWVGLDEGHAGTYRPLRNDVLSVGRQFGLTPFTVMPEEQFLQMLAENDELRAALQSQLEYKVLHYWQIVELEHAANALLLKLDELGIH